MVSNIQKFIKSKPVQKENKTQEMKVPLNETKTTKEPNCGKSNAKKRIDERENCKKNGKRNTRKTSD